MSIVYLNGEYKPAENAMVSVNDRGFLFADGVYEVTPAYRGNFFAFERHLERLHFGLSELRIDAELDGLLGVHDTLLAENDLAGEEVAYVYLQITRGVAPRTHAFPIDPVPPTMYAFASRYQRPDSDAWNRGYRAITIPDRRWARLDIKSIALLPNVLAQQAAVDAGVSDSIYVRNGCAMEGSHNNFFAVFDGVLTTHPASNLILHGITRAVVLEMAEELGIPVAERAIQVESLQWADEAFFTGTTTEIRPTVEIDGRAVGDGAVGPVTRRISEAFFGMTEACAAG